MPYWYIAVRDKRFDQISTSTSAYFTARSALSIMRRVGLAITGIRMVDYHGGFLWVFAGHAGKVKNSCDDLELFLNREEELKILEPATYLSFMRFIREQRNRFLEKLYSLTVSGLPVIGVGAAAKGNTFLNYYRLDHTVLDYVTDSSPYKTGKLHSREQEYRSALTTCSNDTERLRLLFWRGIFSGHFKECAESAGIQGSTFLCLK